MKINHVISFAFFDSLPLIYVLLQTFFFNQTNFVDFFMMLYISLKKIIKIIIFRKNYLIEFNCQIKQNAVILYNRVYFNGKSDYYLSLIFRIIIMEEKRTLLNRIAKQWNAINLYLDNFDNYYAGKAIIQNQNSYTQLISQLLSLMNAFSTSLLSLVDSNKQQQFIKNILKVSLDLLEKYKAQKNTQKISISKTQQKLQNLYCKNCLEHIRSANISNTREKLQKTGNILTQWNQEFENDTIFKSSSVFTQDEDQLFFQQLNKVLSMKEKILSLNDSKMQHFLKSIDEFSKDLQNVSFLTETIKPDDLSSCRNSHWANQLSLQIKHFFKKSFNQKIPKWIQKISSVFIKSYQNYKQKQIKKNQCSYGVQVDKMPKIQNLKEVKIETLEKTNNQLQKKVVDMKKFIIKKEQEHVQQHENYQYKLLESTIKSVKLEKQLQSSKKNVSIAPKQKKKPIRNSQIKQQQVENKSETNLSQDSFIQLKRKKKQKVVTNFQTINIKRDRDNIGVRKSVTVVRNVSTPQRQFGRINRESSNLERINRDSVNLERRNREFGNLETMKIARNSIDGKKSIQQFQQRKLDPQTLKMKLQNQKTVQEQLQQNVKRSSQLQYDASKINIQQHINHSPKPKVQDNYALPKINKKSVLKLSNQKINNPKLLSQLSTNRYFQNTSTIISEKQYLNNDKLQQMYNTLINSGLLFQQTSLTQFKDALVKNQEILQPTSIFITPKNRLSIFNSITSVKKSSLFKEKQKNLIPSHHEDKNRSESPVGLQVNWKQLLDQARTKFNQQTLQVKRDTLFPEYDLGLFSSKKQALYFEESLNKNYHKRQGIALSENQKIIMNKIFNTLVLIKKHNRKAYINLATYIQYPFQAMENGFNPLNIVSGIGLGNFEMYFKKICWLHKKCDKNENNICKHLEMFMNKIQLILGKIYCQVQGAS